MRLNWVVHNRIKLFIMRATSRLFFAALICGLLVPNASSAAELHLSPMLAIEQTDADATFQKVPDIGEGKYLCLWFGDALQAFLMTTHEDFPGNWKAYLQATE